MWRGTAAALAVAAGLGLAGCRREAPLPLETEAFIEVMVSLRTAAIQNPDQARFEAKKQEILKQAGVTEDQLREYARRAPRDPRALSAAYDTINARVQRFREPE